MTEPETKKPNGMTKSMHNEVPDWESCCATPEPYWEEAMENLKDKQQDDPYDQGFPEI